MRKTWQSGPTVLKFQVLYNICNKKAVAFFSRKLNNESHRALMGAESNFPPFQWFLFHFCDMKLRPELYKMLNRETNAYLL